MSAVVICTRELHVYTRLKLWPTVESRKKNRERDEESFIQSRERERDVQQQFVTQSIPYIRGMRISLKFIIKMKLFFFLLVSFSSSHFLFFPVPSDGMSTALAPTIQFLLSLCVYRDAGAESLIKIPVSLFVTVFSLLLSMRVYDVVHPHAKVLCL